MKTTLNHFKKSQFSPKSGMSSKPNFLVLDSYIIIVGIFSGRIETSQFCLKKTRRPATTSIFLPSNIVKDEFWRKNSVFQMKNPRLFYIKLATFPEFENFPIFSNKTLNFLNFGGKSHFKKYYHFMRIFHQICLFFPNFQTNYFLQEPFFISKKRFPLTYLKFVTISIAS